MPLSRQRVRLQSSLILHFVLEGRGGLDDHLKRLADEGEAVRPLPTTAPTHYAVPPVESNGDKDAAAGARRGAGAASGGSGTGATGDVRPKTYVITVSGATRPRHAGGSVVLASLLSHNRPVRHMLGRGLCRSGPATSSRPRWRLRRTSAMR